MEKRLNAKIEEYITKFKDEIRNKMIALNLEDKSKGSDLLQYIYDYDRLCLQKDDFVKRKRVKNSIPNSNRCIAKRANGEQCTRRRKTDCEFCGTHSKGTPHGVIQSNSSTNVTHKVELFATEIRGIVYYLDSMNNVYKTEDVLDARENPRVVAKYVKIGDSYTIPELGVV
jgi:hypothetical protein